MKIPLSVSSTLTNYTDNGPSQLTVTPYANDTGKTTTAAPVLIAVESAATIGADEFAAALPNKGGQGTSAQARLVVNALAAVLSDLVEEYGAFTANTPIGLIETYIAGSVENATDAVDPLVNVPFIGLRPSDAIMRQFAQIEAYVPTSACPASLKRICDKATGQHAIYGTSPFYIEGYGLTTGGTGESISLLNPLTREVVAAAVPSTGTQSTVQITASLASTAAVPAGKYILQVKTLAGGESVIWPLELKVTLAEGIPAPAIDQSSDGTVKIMTAKDGTQSETFTYGNTWTATGIGLFGSGSDRFHVLDCTLKTSSSATGVLMTADCAQDGKSMTCTSMEGETPPAAGTYPNAIWEVNIQKGSGEEQENETLEIPIKLVVA